MTKLMPLPISRAKTAYGLLSDIAKLTLAEPKRMRMESWNTSPDSLDEDERPACGTIGCIGGWVETLRRRQTAQWTLGLTCEQARMLFYDSRLCGEGRQGTPRHARHVVRHIRRFQKKYRK